MMWAKLNGNMSQIPPRLQISSLRVDAKVRLNSWRTMLTACSEKVYLCTFSSNCRDKGNEMNHLSTQNNWVIIYTHKKGKNKLL